MAPRHVVIGELLPHMRAGLDEALKIETLSVRAKARARAQSLLMRTPQLHDVVRIVIELVTTPSRRAA